MPVTLSKKKTIDEIVKQANKLDKLELQILLTQLRVKKLVKSGIKPVANYDRKKIKTPTMQQIDKWKHESRTYNANQ